jgi:hypothetical protein
VVRTGGAAEVVGTGEPTEVVGVIGSGDLAGSGAAGRAFAATLRIAPGAPGAGAQAQVSAELAALPADYAALLVATGPGVLAGALRLLAPGGAGEFDLAAEHRRHADRLLARRAAGLPVVPSPIAPEPGGLRLWAVFGSGETCWWRPAGSAGAGDWPLVLVDADGVGWQLLHRSSTGFLAEWLDGRLDLPVLSLPPVARERVLTGTPDAPATPVGPPAARDPLAQLGTIIGAPPEPPRSYDWAAIERELGISGLPADYKRLTQAYGPMFLNGLLPVDPADLPTMHRDFADELRGWWRENPDDGPLPIVPDPGGLLLCATTESRETLYWDTSDPGPDRWTIIWEVEFDRQTFPGTLTELIIADLTGRLTPALTSLTPSDDGPTLG